MTTSPINVDKVMIAKYIKNISHADAIADFQELKSIGINASSKSYRCLIGNNTVDYFTFPERLNTKGKYNVSFYEFFENIEVFKKKKFIANMLQYYETVKNKNKTKNNYIVLKEVYNICISAINIFRPLVAMEIYAKFKPTSVLDFTCGWGGRLVGACALDIPRFTGLDINTNLTNPYLELAHFLKSSCMTKTNIQLLITDAVTFDYSSIEYDMVLTSPPYFFLEKYSNNEVYNHDKDEMIEQFYKPVIKNTYQHLSQGGHYCLNVNKDLYENVCLPLLGKATEVIPLKKSKRQNMYTEYIYVWLKGEKEELGKI